MALPLYRLSSAADCDRSPWYTALRTLDRQAEADVRDIIDDVREHGDDALVRYTRQWTDPDFTAASIRVDPGELDEALAALDPVLRDDLQTAIDHVRAYQEHITPKTTAPLFLGGAELGLRFTPIQRVGLLVPGGRAAYPTSVIMLAVPALAAGVPADGLCIVTPGPTRGTDTKAHGVSPVVLAAAAMVGVRSVYRVGGAQAVAALAFGTETIPPVDLIAGPGNVYTQLAKQQVAGHVGIDGFYGPSEILTIADDTADPAVIAADLIAQAEHDPGRCLLLSWSETLIEQVQKVLATRLETLARRDAVERSFEHGSAALLVPDRDSAMAVADKIAAEHVNLAVEEPEALLAGINHGGEFFLGGQTPVAAGDYWAGPSHCLPTGTTARYASGVSVYTFLKRSGTVCYRPLISDDAIDAIARLAEAEGLSGHAESVRARRR